MTGRQSRPRRRATIGVDALSRREREVALLASRGLTATEIASHLFVSKRTVESHLVNIYRKLGIGSKTELIRQGFGAGHLAKLHHQVSVSLRRYLCLIALNVHRQPLGWEVEMDGTASTWSTPPRNGSDHPRAAAHQADSLLLH